MRKNFRPSFIDAGDTPWIEALLEEYRRFEGKPAREWRRRLREPFQFHVPQSKLNSIVKAMDDALNPRKEISSKSLKDSRLLLFCLSESVPIPAKPQGLSESIASRRETVLGLAKCQNAKFLEECISFADFASERRIRNLPEEIPLPEIILAANTLLAQGIVQRSSRIDIQIRGQVRPIVRQALLRGLIVVVNSTAVKPDFDVTVSISGPLSLFRHARLYGRLLGEVLPLLQSCSRYELTAFSSKAGEEISWTIKSGDPIRPAQISKFDSKVEKAFYRDFQKITDDYDLLREPEAIPVGRKLIFPDFAIVHCTDPKRRWLLEIVGFWTQAYLVSKMESLKQANIKNLILCVSARHGHRFDWPNEAEIVFFDKKIDANEILEKIRSKN